MNIKKARKLILNHFGSLYAYTRELEKFFGIEMRDCVVHYWFTKSIHGVSPKYALATEIITGGKIKFWEIGDDLKSFKGIINLGYKGG